MIWKSEKHEMGSSNKREGEKMEQKIRDQIPSKDVKALPLGSVGFKSETREKKSSGRRVTAWSALEARG